MEAPKIVTDHDQLTNQELGTLIEARIAELLRRDPLPIEIVNLMLQISDLIRKWWLNQFEVPEMEADLKRGGWIEDEKGRLVQTTGYDEPEGGDKNEGEDGC